MCSLLFCDPLETEGKNHAPGPGISVEGSTAKPETLPPGYILDIYIYIYIHIYMGPFKGAIKDPFKDP